MEVVWAVVVPYVLSHQHLQEFPGVPVHPDNNNNNNNDKTKAWVTGTESTLHSHDEDEAQR